MNLDLDPVPLDHFLVNLKERYWSLGQQSTA